MPKLFDCVVHHHNLVLIVLALTVCVFAMSTVMRLVLHMLAAQEKSKVLWLAVSAGVAGCGIWATHFVAMLAFQLHAPVAYDVPLTALSIFLAIGVSAAGLALLAYYPALTTLGGAICGVAIGVMHFCGMAAYRSMGHMTYEPAYVVASFVVGVPLAAWAYSLVADPSQRHRILWPSLLSVCAIAGLHFTAMAGLEFRPDLAIGLPHYILDPQMLGIAVSAITVAIIGIGLAGVLFDQHLTSRANREAAQLRQHVLQLEDAQQKLESTAQALAIALEAASAGNAAKTRFLATMSHELRTPLNAIIGFSEILEGQIYGHLGDTRYLDYVKSIRKSGVHLLTLIKDILDLTQLDAGQIQIHPARFETEPLIAGIMQFFADRARTGDVRLSCSVEDNAHELVADRNRVRQILLNLVSNAVKFTPPGGAVHVRACRDEKHLSIHVIDTGIGIAAEDIARAVARFGQVDVSTQRRFDGTGVGLPLARELVERHGGTLELDSEPGRGTKVTVIFPQQDDFASLRPTAQTGENAFIAPRAATR